MSCLYSKEKNNSFLSQNICVHFRSNGKTKFFHQILWNFFRIYFFSHNNLLLIFNYFWSTDSETVRLPYEVNWVLQFLLVLQDGLRWLQLLFNLQYCGTTCSFSTGCLHVPSNVHLRNKWNKTGAPNDDFLLNTLKTLFRLSRVVLDLKKYILSGGIKLDSVRSP